MAEADLVAAAAAPVVQAATTLADNLIEVGAMAAGTRAAGTVLRDAAAAVVAAYPDDTSATMTALRSAVDAWAAAEQHDFHTPGA